MACLLCSVLNTSRQLGNWNRCDERNVVRREGYKPRSGAYRASVGSNRAQKSSIAARDGEWAEFKRADLTMKVIFEVNIPDTTTDTLTRCIDNLRYDG